MFATTLEHVISTYTLEYNQPPVGVGTDGSMHTHKKIFHTASADSILDFLSNNPEPTAVTTPIYPFEDREITDIIKVYGNWTLPPDNTCIIVHGKSQRDCELNLLFQYHKIVNGHYFHYGFDFFFNSNEHNIVHWNKNYKSWHDMRQWELREWYSLFYPGVIHKWINSQYLVPDHFLQLSNFEILNNPLLEFKKVIQHCKLTEKDGLEDFSKKWKQAQQYIVDEFLLLDQIIKHTLEKQPFEWHDLNIFAESIIQRRLRDLGYEIRCDGLDIFPTNSETLANLLERV
jgi:hypothetical protein